MDWLAFGKIKAEIYQVKSLKIKNIYYETIDNRFKKI